MFRIRQQPRSLAATFLFIPDTVCHSLVRLLDDEYHIRSGYSDMLIHEQKSLNLPLRQLTCPGIPGWYCTPDFDDGSRLTLDQTVAGQITITAYGDGMASDRHILTPAHPLWKNISNRLTHMNLIQEWRDWAAIPAPGEQRAVALEKVTTCLARDGTELYLDRLGLTSLPDLPDSLLSLSVRTNQLTSLPDLPDSLTWLDASENQLTSLPTLPDSLTWLYTWSNQLTALPDLPDSLTTFYVRTNRLTALPTLPLSLTDLIAGSNRLTALPDLPDSLTKLDVSDNRLTALPDLPDSLTRFNVSRNQLTALPTLPPSLNVLSIYNNQLTALPTLPRSLKELWVSFNRLIALPVLPLWLTRLESSYNQLTSLPPLPLSLTKLDVSYNQLTSLPPLPLSLTTLDVSNNRLSALPTLPPSLKELDVRINRLTALSAPLPSLTVLYVSYNQLTSLPPLPLSLTRLNVIGNQLTSLPPLPASLQGVDVGLRPLETDRSALVSRYPAEQQETVHTAWTPRNTVGLRPLETDRSTLVSAIISWYPAEQQETVHTAWTPQNTVENAGVFTKFLDLLNENPCARLPEFRARVAAWLDELLITPELCTLSFAIAQEASATCTDRAALGWNNMQVARLLFHAVCNEQTTADEFITLARQIFRLRETERIAGEKVRLLTAAKKKVDEIEVYLAYQIQLKIPLGLPDCLAPQMLFDYLAAVTPEDISIAAEDVRLAEEAEFTAWLNNWAPCQQFLLKRMSEDEREALTERRTTVYGEKLEELRLEFSEAGSGTDIDRVLGVRATEATNNAIFGPLAEQAFFMSTGHSSKGKEKG